MLISASHVDQGFLFSHLFNGKTVAQATKDFEKFLSAVSTQGYSVSSPARRVWARFEAIGADYCAKLAQPQRPATSDPARVHRLEVQVGLRLDDTKLVVLAGNPSGPHMTDRFAIQVGDPQMADRYRALRDAFALEFWHHCRTRLWPSALPGCLCGAVLDYSGKTVEEVSDWIEGTLEALSAAASLTIHEFDAGNPVAADDVGRHRDTFLFSHKSGLLLESETLSGL